MTILIVMFVAILIFTFGVLHLTLKPDTSDKAIRARVESLRAASKEANADDQDLVREDPEGISRLIGERLKNFHFADELERLIVHSGSNGTVGSIALASVLLSLAAGLITHVFVQAPPLVILAAAAGGMLRYWLLRFKKAQRLKKFEAALPDAIELMTRALRAGHSMASSIEAISEQSAEPLKGEFGLCFQQQRFGIPFRDALLAMGERMPSKDLHFLITAILVQKETGGDLTEILDRAARVIRERMKIQGEVRTHTAQGRLTGWILGLMPVIMLMLLNLISPGYSDVLLTDPFGQKLLYAGAALIVIGGLIIRKIVDIKI